MDEQNIGDLQCMVRHSNKKVEKICSSKRKQRSFQLLEMKNIGLVETHFLFKYICFSESASLLTLSQKIHKY